MAGMDRGALLALCLAAGAWGGCRQERPTAAPDGTGDGGTTTADNGKSEEPDFGEEPAIEVRKAHQAPDVVVVSVNANGVTWVDGDLAVMFDLHLRLKQDREKGRTKVKLLVAQDTPLDAWSQLIPVLEQAGYGEADRLVIFDQPGLGRPEPAPPGPEPAPPPGSGR